MTEISNIENLVSGVNSNTTNTVITTLKPCIDKLGRAYGTGRRKTSVARVWIKPGTGKIQINKDNYDGYFYLESSKEIIFKPFVITKTMNQFDVYCTVKGGGTTGQVDAICHGISRALNNYDPDAFHTILASNKLLTRDDRMVESKKYGRHKARRSTQFSKR